MMKLKTMVLLAALAAPALPAMAQEGAPPPHSREGHKARGEGMGGFPMMRETWAKLSPQGQTQFRDAIRAGKPTDAEEAQMKQARDQILALMSAERLDERALKAAFASERAMHQRNQERRHEVMVRTLTQMSAADRKVLTDGMREMRDRKETRRERMRDRRGEVQKGPAQQL